MGLQGYVGSSQDQTRIRRQEKEREEQRRKIEELKRETEAKVTSAGLRRFGTGTAEILESAFKNETVGLVTREEFLRKKNDIEERLESQEKQQGNLNAGNTKRKQKRSKQRIKAVLSFDEEEEDGAALREIKVPKKKETDRKEKLSKYGKCPTVETEFLPDADRERQERELREKLKQEWKARQEAIKAEDMEIVYSYWDGTGHRHATRVKKGATIGEFLRLVREQLSKNFKELRMASVDNLLYVKDDVIIPHSYTFYDLVICKAQGKSGPLFDFNAEEDMHVAKDASEEHIDNHAGKVVERHWYDRNKHIFPSSKWEPYDPEATTEGYTG